MSRIIKITIILFLLFSCKQSSEKETVNVINTEVTKENKQLKFNPNSIKEISKTLPKQIKYKGELKSAYSRMDLNGENILLNSVKYTSKYNEIYGVTFRSGYFYSYHFLKKKGEYKLLVLTTDKEEDCDFDLIIDLKTKPIIQDIDDNGIAEVILAFIKTCTSDISPKTLKVLMHENKQKYALRGMEYLHFTEEAKLTEDFEFNKEKYKGVKVDYDWEYGRYENEHEFKNAPKSFIIEARKVWKENVVWGEE